MAIPYGRQSITESDITAVSDVLRSDFLTQGPTVPKFEAALSKRCGAQFAVAMNSATSALHLGCMALGVGAGDTVWTSPISFVATANLAPHRWLSAASNLGTTGPCVRKSERRTSLTAVM